MSPDFAQSFCLGAVSGGVKFCTLGKEHCSFQSHKATKIEVFVNHLYISGGRNAAYSQHHADISQLTSVQLENVLRERHPRNVWVSLIHGLNLNSASNIERMEGREELVSAITPCKKRKQSEGFMGLESNSIPDLQLVSSDESDGLVKRETRRK